MDLQLFDTRTAANEGRRLVLLDPAGRETDAVLILCGADSDVYVAAEQAAADDRYERGRDNPDQLTSITAAELFAENIRKLVRVTKGWENLTAGGAPLPVTPANAQRIYEDAPTIREQAWKFVHARANFGPPSKLE